ncbi:MAG: hypothetical protein BMS9Abin34_143 [Patescibacteria group bacterium]|nr:MAG: hypothetical protein BMS9Abin34_143 [Patescibacteria group bacterium]
MIRFLLVVTVASATTWFLGRPIWEVGFILRVTSGLWIPVLWVLMFALFTRAFRLEA